MTATTSGSWSAACAAAAMMISGCAAPRDLPTRLPDVSVLSMRPYTAQEIAAASTVAARDLRGAFPDLDDNKPLTLDTVLAMHMEAYFSTTSARYPQTKRRMDQMLDGRQKMVDLFSSIYQYVQLSAHLSPNPTSPPALPPMLPLGNDPAAAEADQAVIAARANVAKAQSERQAAAGELAVAALALEDTEAALEKATAASKDEEDAKRAAEERKAAVDADLGAIDREALAKQEAIDDVDAELTLAGDAVKRRNTRLTTLEQRLPNAAPADKPPIEQEIAAIKGEIVVLEREQSALATQKELLQREKTQIERRKTPLLARQRDLQTELDAADARVTKAMHEAKVEDRKAAVTTAKGKVEAAQTALKTKQTAVDAAEAVVSEKRVLAEAKLASQNPFLGARDQFTGVIGDSPFDTLDRVRNFFAAYILSFVAIQPDALVSPRERSTDTTYPSAERQILLLIQLDVDPGQQPNYQALWRCRPDKVFAGATEHGASSVRLIRTHPTRTYDISDELLIDRAAETIDLAFSAVIPKAGVGGSARAISRKQREARQNFLSRHEKTGSVSGVEDDSFGWKFSPTNLSIKQPSLAEHINAALLGRKLGEFIVNGTIEGGGRTCAAYLSIPWEVTRIEFVTSVEYFNIGEFEAIGINPFPRGPKRRIAVNIPPPSTKEIEAVKNATGLVAPAVGRTVQ